MPSKNNGNINFFNSLSSGKNLHSRRTFFADVVVTFSKIVEEKKYENKIILLNRTRVSISCNIIHEDFPRKRKMLNNS